MKKSTWIKKILTFNIIVLPIVSCVQSETTADKSSEGGQQKNGEITMTNPKNKALVDEITDLEATMHEVDQNMTLEEKIAEMKRRGIDPSESYKKWDDEEDQRGSENK